jgi:hypothetical protein
MNVYIVLLRTGAEFKFKAASAEIAPGQILAVSDEGKSRLATFLLSEVAGWWREDADARSYGFNSRT